MEDRELHKRIANLVTEERELEESHIGSRITAEQERRLGEVREALDQSWDLLRQRRARREFNQDVATTGARPAEVVEHYQQ
jgi:hypothetical protein